MILLEPRAFDPYAHLSAFSAEAVGAGAVASFIGVVRGDDGKGVLALFLDYFPGVTEKAITQAAEEARRRWPLVGVRIVHRIGEVKVGEPVVLVAVAAVHRRPALEACDFLMDFLKTEAPFWKKERRKDGDVWIEPRAEDYADRARWDE
ncbi:MAG: molybdenum cofactor biosynthesis protein MoaE [Pseudomonadota bacterium]|nr:molybdenum cofactor biosynthesis protein MoaE [Pseudomonadota bacterium]